MVKNKNEWLVVTDGACSGNPGPGGWGAVVVSPFGMVQELDGGEESSTNNRMELSSVLFAFEYVLKVVEKEATLDSVFTVKLVSDSSYVLEGLKSRAKKWSMTGWITTAGTPVLNQDLWQKALELLDQLKKSNLKLVPVLVPGHSGIALNERVDEIAVNYAKNQEHDSSLYTGTLAEYNVSLDLTPFQLQYLSYVDGRLQTHTNWTDCQKATSGKKGAKFKKVQSLQEKQKILKEWGIQ